MKPNIKRHNKTLWISLIVIVTALFGFYLSEMPKFKPIEEAGLNILFQVGTRSTNDKIAEVAVVMVDEVALEKDFGYYDPLPRRYLARLIDTLCAKNAKVIAMDIALYDRLKMLDSKGDSILVRSMQRAKNVIAVSIFQINQDGDTYVQNPDSFFIKGLKGVGFANLQISGGGGLASVREVQPVSTMSDGQSILSFSSLMYCVYKGIEPENFLKDVQSGSFVPNIPLNKLGAMIINYVGGPATWKKETDGNWLQVSEGRIVTYRSSRLTGDTVWPEDLFKDKLVVIGNGSEFVPDRFVTPYYNQSQNNWMYGAEVHANAFLTLLNENFMKRSSTLFTIGICLLLSFLMVMSTVKFGFAGEISMAVGLLLSVWMGGYLLFSHMGIWLPVSSLSFTVLVSYFVTSIYQAFTEERNKRQIRNMFARYAPPAYVDELVKDPTKLELGGVEKEISILFSDIEGFTAISEKMAPTQLIELLNEYLGAMTQIIFKEGGTLDKYIGDAIVAVFGAPLPQNEHALHACYAALEMQRTLAIYRDKWSQRGLPPIKNRIGLNTGKVVFGNIGSEIRYDYTAIGDHMNLSSRLEGANKEYGTYCMISEFMYEQVRERVVVRDLDVLVVKGKTKGVRVYELIGKANEPLPEDQRKLIENYQEGIKNYRDRKWNEAIQKFEQALTHNHTDEPSKMYIRRCKAFMENPPGDDWDGSFHMTSK